MVKELDVVRVHVSGDFNSADYVRLWTEIAEKCPQTTFGAYTRSWVVPEIERALSELATRPNVELFLSLDDTMEQEPPSGWWYRRAYVKPTLERLPGVALCPNQVQAHRGRPRGERVTCMECGICYRPPGKVRDVVFAEH